MFHTPDELYRHVQRCMPKAEKLAAERSASRSRSAPPKRQSTRVTSVPLRVCVNYDTKGSIVARSGNDRAPAASVSASVASSMTDASNGNAAALDILSSGDADNAGSFTSGVSRADSTESDVTSRGNGNSGGGGGASISWAGASNGGSAPGGDNNNRLRWSASLSVDDSEGAAVLGRRSRSRRTKADSRRRNRSVTIPVEAASRLTATATLAASSGSDDGAAASPGSCRSPRAPPVSSTRPAKSRGRNLPLGKDVPGPTSRASPVRGRGSPAGGGVGGADTGTDRGSALARVAARATVREDSTKDMPSATAVRRTRSSNGRASGGTDGAGGKVGSGCAPQAVVSAGAGKEEAEEQEDDDDDDDDPVSPTGVKPTGWRGSLGTWGVNGGFTCPVNPVSGWGVPGCGTENRARDNKCDTCHRVLRVDWQVG